MKKIKLLQTVLLSSIVLSCGQNAEPISENQESEIAIPTYTNENVRIFGTAGEKVFLGGLDEDTMYGGKTFFNAYTFKNNFCPVAQMIDEKVLWGLINLEGDQVVECKYKSILPAENCMLFKFRDPKSGFSGVLDTTGKELIPATFGGIDIFNESGAIGTKSGGYLTGKINLKNEVVIPFEYDYIGAEHDGHVPVSKNNKKGYFDSNGNLLTELIYDLALPYENDIGLVKKDGKIGFLNSQNELFIDFIYEGYKKNSQWHETIYYGEYIETDIKFTIEDKYIALKKDGYWGYIDLEGNTVVPFEYDKIWIKDSQENQVQVEKNGKTGYFDLKSMSDNLP